MSKKPNLDVHPSMYAGPAKEATALHAGADGPSKPSGPSNSPPPLIGSVPPLNLESGTETPAARAKPQPIERSISDFHASVSDVDRQLDQRVTDLSAEIGRQITEMHRHLSDQVNADIHTTMSHVDRQLDARLSGLQVELGKQITEMHRHLSEHLNADIHTTMSHIDRQLDARLRGLQVELGKQITETYRQLSEQMAENIHDTISHVDRHLSGLIINQRDQSAASSGKSDPDTIFLDDPAAEDRIRQIGQCLQLEAARSHHLVRVGGDTDGGYLLLDDFGGIDTAFSFGVGDEISWDSDMAARGVTVHQFDHTVGSAPSSHELIHFHRIRIAPLAEQGAESLSSALRYAVTDKPVIVKMDIEGDEWTVLQQLADIDADRIAQLVCEFHNFDQIALSEGFELAVGVLEKLRARFGVLHLHANNYGRVMVVGTITFPEILEVSFANRKHYNLAPATIRLPNPLDRPNRKDIMEIVLGSFRY